MKPTDDRPSRRGLAAWLAGITAGLGSFRLFPSAEAADVRQPYIPLAGMTPGNLVQVASDGFGLADAGVVAAATKYIVGFSATNGVLTASQLLGEHAYAGPVTIEANFAAFGPYSTQARGTANATASTVLTVAKAPAATPNTFTTIGTITFAAGTVNPTFATSGGTAVNFAAGDLIRVTGPASPDATFANPTVTIVAHA